MSVVVELPSGRWIVLPVVTIVCLVGLLEQIVSYAPLSSIIELG